MTYDILGLEIFRGDVLNFFVITKKIPSKELFWHLKHPQDTPLYLEKWRSMKWATGHDPWCLASQIAKRSGTQMFDFASSISNPCNWVRSTPGGLGFKNNSMKCYTASKSEVANIFDAWRQINHFMPTSFEICVHRCQANVKITNFLKTSFINKSFPHFHFYFHKRPK